MGKHEVTRDKPSSSLEIQQAIDWLGDEDPDNPRNFSLVRRLCSTIAVTFLAFVSTFAASIYSPGYEDVAKEFQVSDEIAILPMSLYTLGLAFGPLAGSPLSETFGRKVVFLVTTPIFALFILGSGFSHNAMSLNICRFFAGVFASPAISNASATIVDFTAARYRAVSLAFYYSIPFFGAVLGPLVGGFIVLRTSWRWTQWTTLFFVVAFYIPVWFTKETYKKTILQRRAKLYNVEGPPTLDLSFLEAVQYFLTILILRPLHMLLTEPIVTLVCMYMGFQFGLMYTFVIASPWIFQTYYNFDLAAQSLSFIGLTIGTGCAPLPLVAIDYFIYQPRLKKFRETHPENEQFPPENRLFPAMICSFLLPSFLFILAWVSRPSIHWICPIIFETFFIMSSLLVYASSNLFMIDAYGPLYGASASGAAMLTRYTMSAVFPLFTLQMYRALGVGWATSLLGFCALAMAPIPWLFWKFGAKLRAKSRYETSA